MDLDEKVCSKGSMSMGVLPVILHTQDYNFYIWGLLALTDGSFVTMPPMDKAAITSLTSISLGIHNNGTIDSLPTCDAVGIPLMSLNCDRTILEFILDTLKERGHIN